MFAYCLGNPACRIDISGTNSVENFTGEGDVDHTDDDQEIAGGKMPSSNSSNSGQAVKAGSGNGTINNGQGNSGTNPVGRTEVHHVVEQCQAQKSGFSQSQIQADSNKVELSYADHRAISGYYSSKQPFTNGMRVRDWLAGYSFEIQTQFGWYVIEMCLTR